MTEYWPGQRIRLLTGTVPGVQHGELGVVDVYDAVRRTVMVDFDRGAYGPLPLDDDRVRIEALPTGPRVLEWGRTVAGVYAAGRQAGDRAASGWALRTFAGRSTSDTVETALAVLDGIADNEPAVLETLPNPGTSAAAGRDVYATVTGDGAAWTTLLRYQREDIGQSYGEGFDAGLRDRVTDLCRDLAAAPRTGSALVASLPGGLGAAVPSWAQHGGSSRYTQGYAAVLIEQSGTDIVFGCTRTVAEKITTELRRHHGHPADQSQTPAGPVRYHDGDTTVISEQELLQHPAGIDQLDPGTEPEYQVRAPAATWSIVTPEQCDQIIGDLDERRQVLDSGPLPTQVLQVPHRALRLVRLCPPLVRPGSIFTAALLWNGTPAGAVHHWGTPSMGVHLSDPDVLDEATLRRYLDGCRLDGQPVTAAHALRYLTDEALLGDVIDEAYRAGGTVLRQPDAEGSTLLCQPYVRIPDGPAGLQQLSNHLAGNGQGQHWQIWTGRRWLPLPAATNSA